MLFFSRLRGNDISTTGNSASATTTTATNSTTGRPTRNAETAWHPKATGNLHTFSRTNDEFLSDLKSYVTFNRIVRCAQRAVGMGHTLRHCISFLGIFLIVINNIANFNWSRFFNRGWLRSFVVNKSFSNNSKWNFKDSRLASFNELSIWAFTQVKQFYQNNLYIFIYVCITKLWAGEPTSLLQKVGILFDLYLNVSSYWIRTLGDPPLI